MISPVDQTLTGGDVIWSNSTTRPPRSPVARCWPSQSNSTAEMMSASWMSSFSARSPKHCRAGGRERQRACRRPGATAGCCSPHLPQPASCVRHQTCVARTTYPNSKALCPISNACENGGSEETPLSFRLAMRGRPSGRMWRADLQTLAFDGLDHPDRIRTAAYECKHACRQAQAVRIRLVTISGPENFRLALYIWVPPQILSLASGAYLLEQEVQRSVALRGICLPRTHLVEALDACSTGAGPPHATQQRSHIRTEPPSTDRLWKRRSSRARRAGGTEQVN